MKSRVCNGVCNISSFKTSKINTTKFRNNTRILGVNCVSISCTSSTYSVAPNSGGGAWLVSRQHGRGGERQPRPLRPSVQAEGNDLWPQCTPTSLTVMPSEPEADGKHGARRWSEKQKCYGKRKNLIHWLEIEMRVPLKWSYSSWVPPGGLLQYSS